MNGRKLTALTAIAAILALGEFGSAVMIWKENYPGSFPPAAIAFGVLFLAATWLLRSGRVAAGTIFTGVLCLVEVVLFPVYARHAVADWVVQIAFCSIALAGVVLAAVVLAGRLRRRAAA